jgi:cell wall-associated NlpC family hydrolase
MKRFFEGLPLKVLAVMLLSALFVLPLSSVAYASIYNRGNAIGYANTYYNNYNPQYTSFSEDCTNFTSQCMYAGGLPMVNCYNNVPAAWWYNFSNTTWSNTWSVAANQETFLVLNSSPHWGYVASSYLAPTNAYPSGVSPGDLFYYSWYNNGVINHAGIYVANGTDPHSGDSGALQDQHTTNRQDAIWTLYPYNQYFNTTAIYCVHITE